MFKLPSLLWLRTHHTKIHFFGLGFIQIKINETLRFHFYTKRLESIMPKEEIHNHRYAFRSYILKGDLNQEIFQITAGDTHVLVDVDCKEGSVPHVGSMLWKPVLITDMTLAVGSTYDIRDYTYHRVWSENCITKIERGSPVKDKAAVCRPRNSPSVCPFSCKTPVGTLWDIVEDMISV